MKKLYDEIEKPLIPVLHQMEESGVLIDDIMLQVQSDEISVTLQELETKAYESAEKQFNLSSPKQLQEILFDNLKLPVIKKTPKGQPSTSEDVLQN